MRQDLPNRIAFDEIVGTLVARLAEQGRVCIYGEMVDVLAARGQYKAAYQLEVLWNALGKREPFTLFCGYSSAHFGDPKTAAILGQDLRDAQPRAPQEGRPAGRIPARAARCRRPRGSTGS